MPVAGLLSGRFGSMERRWRGGSQTALPADRLPSHVAIAAVALSIAATAVPLALILAPELRGQIAPPRFANLMLGRSTKRPFCGFWSPRCCSATPR
jgi:hypothetical protein